MGTSKAASNVDESILRLLREVIPWQFSKKEIRPEMSLQAELGIDSFGKMAIAFRLEEEFGVDLSQFSGGIEEVRTVGNLIDVARGLLESKG